MKYISNIRRNKMQTGSRINIRFMTITAMLSALSFVIMFFDFSVPLIPSFVKMDVSELPALIGSFSMGPVYGVLICLLKNLLHLTVTKTGGVGELSNFILGATFVFVAGLIYQHKKTKKNAIIGSLIGALAMALMSIPSNYFITYPIYTAFMPMETIIAMYQAILPSADTLIKCLIIFNAPFTFVKGMLSVIITLLIYKKLSPIIKGTR
ncbi:MAG: ECF transporter S component [Lachnospiraceae bacterium]|nr:ECF transporter S component [Lachnospiraceae bacterium]